MSFPLPENILQSPHVAFKQIMQKVKNNQNGSVSRQMQSRGMNYKLNYGVTVPLLKSIASEYKKDNALATQLLNCGIREGVLLSSFLFDEENLSNDKAIRIAEGLHTVELVEQFSLNLYLYLPKLKEIVEILLKGSVPQKQIALYSMSWGFKKKTLPMEYAQQALLIAESIVAHEAEPLLKGINMLLQSILFVDVNLSNNVFALAEKMELSTNENINKAGKDFLWLHRD